MSRYATSFKSTAASLALSAATFLSSPASAGEGHMNSMSFNAESAWTTLHVTSTDGVTWDRIQPGTLQFWGHMKIDMLWPGYVHKVGVVLGNCGAACGNMPRIWSASPRVRDYNYQTNFSFNADIIPVSAGGIPVLPYGDEILARCNQHLQADGPTKSHTFNYEMSATFVTDTNTVWDLDNAIYEVPSDDWPHIVRDVDHSRSDKFTVSVVCDPVRKLSVADLQIDSGDFEVENVKLFLTTYQTTQSGSNPGTKCPALKVTARAEASKAGPVSMRLWGQNNVGPITQQFQQAWASFDAAKNGYFATWEQFIDVGTTSTFQFKVEVEDGTPFGPSDGWKSINVHCTGAGGGGLAPQPPVNPDFPSPQASWDGAVTLADSAGAKKECPRKGQVFFAVTRPSPGNFRYRISCSNGAFFSGTAVAYNQGNGVFEAFGAHEFSIARTRKIQCTLQEMTESGASVTVGKDDFDFTCIKRNVEPGPGGIVSEPRDIPGRPVTPTVAVPVPATPDCGWKQVLVRDRCIDRPDISILCAPGFQLVGKKCLQRPVIVNACNRGETRIDGKCVRKPGVSILCAPGFELVGKKCLKRPVIVTACKRGEIRIDGKCAMKPTVSILCKRGYKRVGDKCVRTSLPQVACKRGEKIVRGLCVGKPSAKPVKKRSFKTRQPAGAARAVVMPRLKVRSKPARQLNVRGLKRRK